MTQTLPPWIQSKTYGGFLNPVISITVAQNWLGQGGDWNQGHLFFTWQYWGGKEIKLTAKTVDEDPACYKRWISR